jgi:hypothetical protein
VLHGKKTSVRVALATRSYIECFLDDLGKEWGEDDERVRSARSQIARCYQAAEAWLKHPCETHRAAALDAWLSETGGLEDRSAAASATAAAAQDSGQAAQSTLEAVLTTWEPSRATVWPDEIFALPDFVTPDQADEVGRVAESARMLWEALLAAVTA